MDNDRIKGKGKGLAGRAEEKVGQATGDKPTERSCQADQVVARFRKATARQRRTRLAARSERQ